MLFCALNSRVDKGEALLPTAPTAATAAPTTWKWHHHIGDIVAPGICIQLKQQWKLGTAPDMESILDTRTIMFEPGHPPGHRSASAKVGKLAKSREAPRWATRKRKVSVHGGEGEFR